MLGSPLRRAPVLGRSFHAAVLAAEGLLLQPAQTLAQPFIEGRVVAVFDGVD